MADLIPDNAAEAAEMIAAAKAEGTRLSIEGGGTRAGLGRPTGNDQRLSTRKLTGVTLYEPAEMVVGAQAGTTLAEIEALLATHGQRLAFEPMDSRALYGSSGEPTIGAIAACNISGPRRVAVGAARDHLVGVKFVNGRAEAIKAGGRVMKNVTGLDLTKLSAGAFGTLGLLTQVIFKVMPLPELVTTLVFEGLDDAAALQVMTGALGSPFEVSGAAHLPGGDGTAARTLLRLEGFPASLSYRNGQLATLFAAHGTPTVIDGEAAEKLWRAVRDGAPLGAGAEAEIWRASVAPAKAGAFMAGLRDVAGLRHYYDWGGGLVWLAAVPDSGFETTLRRATAATGGHAMLVRAAAERRAAIDVFEPLAAPLMQLTAGIKASLDPAGILNFGRMYRDI